MGARWVPKTTQTPANTVGTRPFTRSFGVICRTVPGGANRSPKMVAIAFDDSTVMGGALNPALTIPPVETTGAVGESAVSENATLRLPLAAETVTVPAVLPRVTLTLAVPSGSVIACAGVTIAAFDGFAEKVTTTPGTPAPLASVTFTTRRAGSCTEVSAL